MTDLERLAPARGAVASASTIDALTGVRAVAAFWVVVHHFEPAITTLVPILAVLHPVFEHGWLGVEVFFLLSGFVIAHNYADRLASASRADLRTFWWARVARVYPVHLATLLFMAVLVVGAAAIGLRLNTEYNYSAGNVAANLLLGQALPGFRAINWPAWSVSCEAVAYLAFPALALLLARLSARRALAAAAAVLALCMIAMPVYGVLAGPWDQLAYPVMWLRIATEFTAGALLWVWWRAKPRRMRLGDAVTLVSGTLGIVVLFLTGRDSPAVFLALPFIAAFVVGAASSAGPVATILGSRLFVWGGRVSYSLYMVHFFVFIVAKKILNWEQFAASPLLVRLGVATALTVLVVAAASATFYLVEEPGRKLIRRWTSSRGRA